MERNNFISQSKVGLTPNQNNSNYQPNMNGSVKANSIKNIQPNQTNSNKINQNNTQSLNVKFPINPINQSAVVKPTSNQNETT